MATWSPPVPIALPPGLVEAAGGPWLAQLLYRRGCTTPAAVEAFLHGEVDLDDPLLPDLDPGVAELSRAVLARERITVYGDYDTDGVTSTALLVSLLRYLGADVDYYIPDRFRDGYGMNERAVTALAGAGTRLLLTCDCGIKSVSEVTLARAMGMRVVVTDHHELGPELPTAEAVINPKRLPEAHPSRMLPGVGTAYLVARRLLRQLDRDPAEADRWLDLVAVGIIADVVPLQGANRELGRRGLARLNTSPCPGLRALAQVAGLSGELTEEEVAFQLVPRLNSAGRLGDARLAVRLLLAVATAEAMDLALRLDELNSERKRLTAAVVDAARTEVVPGAKAVLLYRPEWHEGVLGIAAGRLAEEYAIPVFLMTRKHGSNLLVGSARSPGGKVPLHEALESCGEHLVKHGGHAAAAGFSLLEENFPAFRAAMLEEVRRRNRPEAEAPERAADVSLPLAHVDRRLYEELRLGAPYGAANPAPVLHSPGVKLLSARAIGPGEKHLRLVLRDGPTAIPGVWWGAGPVPPEPQECELFYRLQIHRWNGEEQLQAVVESLVPASRRGPGLTAAALQGPELTAAAPQGLEEPAILPAGESLVSESPQGFGRPPATSGAPPRPRLIDRRSQSLPFLQIEFPGALFVAEGISLPGQEQVADRYSLRPAADLVWLTPPPSPRLFDEALAITGAQRVVLAWPAEGREEERFLPGLMRLLAQALENGPWVSLATLAVKTGALEATVSAGLDTLVESHLLAIDEVAGDRLRLRRRTDGQGIQPGPTRERLKRLLGESRSYRRFLQSASLEAIQRTLR